MASKFAYEISNTNSEILLDLYKSNISKANSHLTSTQNPQLDVNITSIIPTNTPIQNYPQEINVNNVNQQESQTGIPELNHQASTSYQRDNPQSDPQVWNLNGLNISQLGDTTPNPLNNTGD